MNKCSIKDCINTENIGIQSFDNIKIKDGSTRSEIIPYCSIHIEDIRSGKIKDKLHQEFHYINYELDRLTKKLLQEGYEKFSIEELKNKQLLNSRLQEIMNIWESNGYSKANS